MSHCVSDYEKTGILPVINIPESGLAIPVAEALRAGGVNAIEVTLRSPDSLESIRKIKTQFPDMAVGAGTVLSRETVDAARKSGAEFIVSPGYDDEVVDYCLKQAVPVIPGCVMAGDIQKAVKKGLKVLKFFPAELSGGLDAIKLLAGPFPEVRFIPTGGIGFHNLGSYLANKKILACGGSYMATAEQIKNGDFDGITAACKKAIDISLGFELAHVGVNCGDEGTAVRVAETIADTFRLSPRYMNSAVFAGTAVEAVKADGWGRLGHIGFLTNSIPRAMAYFQSKGIALNEESIKRNKAGEITCIYLREDIGGFAYHVVAR